MWNKDFFLLVQGQAVSHFGSTLYSVVASLWVYELTGSALIMGTVYSASNIARLITFPFAGVIVDKFPKRNLIVFCDILCGLSMLCVAAVSVSTDTDSVWILILHSTICGFVSAIFAPSINMLMLSAVSKQHYVQADSIYSSIECGIDLIGQGLSGALYVLLGAPCLFFINGVTFLFSAATEMFISKDDIPRRTQKKTFIADATEGIRYILQNQGVFCNLSAAFLINFAFGILKVILIPWMLVFGEEYYGLLGSFRSAGAVIGTLILSIIKIPEKKQYTLYRRCQIIYISCIGIAAIIPNFYPIAALFCIAYINQYIFNALQRSAVFISAPNEIRGKVICAVQALAMGFSAAGNLMGGILGESSRPQSLVFILMVFLLLGILFLTSRQSVKQLFGAQ